MRTLNIVTQYLTAVLPGTIFTNCAEVMEGNDFVQWVGLAAGVCTSISLLPQLLKLVKEKKADDISLFYLLLLCLGLGLWTYYGVLRDDLPIIITNSFSILVNITVIVLSIKYKSNQKN